jgi:hypothetical protein
MRQGRPSAPGKPSKRGGPASQTQDRFSGLVDALGGSADPDDPESDPGVTPSPDLTRKGIPRRKPDPSKPRTCHKRSFVGMLLAEDRLTKDDKAAIKEAHTAGITVQDVAALVAYEIRLARNFFANGELAAKDLIVCLNKAASQAAAAAQLAQTGTVGMPTRIEVSLTGATPVATATHPDRPDRADPDPQIGDLIDAE